MNRKVTTFLIFFALFLAPLFSWAEDTLFAIVSDTHVGVSNSLYPAIIHRIEEEQIKVIIHTGDAIEHPGDVRDWGKFFDIQGPLKILHLAPGNHDINGKVSFEVYLTFFSKPYYSFSDGDVLFILLNTELPGEESMIQGKQLAWLEAELQRPFHYKFVFLHEPLFPIFHQGLARHEQARDALHRLFVQNGVSLVVAGHDHIYDRTVKDGIVYIIMPPARGQTRYLIQNGEPGYIVATKKNNSFSFVLKDIRGKVRDEFFVPDDLHH
jgi:3',5'-cyclic AMP phosphodiesterase CpdA